MLNGWQRLFCVCSVILILPGIATWVMVKPSKDAYQFAIECGDLNRGYDFSPATAASALAEHPTAVSDSLRGAKAIQTYAADGRPVMWSDCAAKLGTIASGEVAKQKRAEWIGLLGYGALFYAALLGSMYAAGWSLGWVLRGFRKN